MTAHALAKELLSMQDVPVVLSPKYGPSVEVVGTSFWEVEQKQGDDDEDEEEEEDGEYLSWNLDRLEYDKKKGSTITII